jgi:2-C-methyl-D-erythritol 4-phosphate cytidylyltransferase / 2-C-methyl-D-erythritol 2,4-cyclodiphosphate synthase
MSAVAVLLAAGRGDRFGADKTWSSLGGRPLWRFAYDALAAHPDLEGVVLVVPEDGVEAFRRSGVRPLALVAGGSTRQESARRGLEAAPDDAEVVLFHDAARPFLPARIVTDVVAATRRSGAAAPAVPVADTIKMRGDDGVSTLDRGRLVAVQTPQGARADLLRRAYAAADREFTDDLAMLEAIGIQPELTAGDPDLFKVTHPQDLRRAEGVLGPAEVRTGMGYDIHAVSPDPTRPLFLGGVRFEGHPGLEGHSDADVLLHAATDALLGAAALGDIGVHFPNTDARWKDQPSMTFLSHAGQLLTAAGWSIVNVDATLLAESPKIMGRAAEIRGQMGEALGIEPGRISVKATTNERLGAIGRSEGMAAMAVATIRRAGFGRNLAGVE